MPQTQKTPTPDLSFSPSLSIYSFIILIFSNPSIPYLSTSAPKEIKIKKQQKLITENMLTSVTLRKLHYTVPSSATITCCLYSKTLQNRVISTCSCIPVITSPILHSSQYILCLVCLISLKTEPYFV